MDAATSTDTDPEYASNHSDQLQDDDVESAEPTLPPLSNARQRPQPLHLSRKRTSDDLFSTSSDPPIFSSDDLPPGLENYSTHRSKRQHHGPWWMTPSRQEQRMSNRGVRQKREFKRNIDSGVWMNSDDTEMDEGSDLTEGQVSKAAANQFHDDDQIDYGMKVRMMNDGFQALTDNGPDPELSWMYLVQKAVRHDVLRLTEEGCEVFDLSDLALGELSGSTIQPLRYLTKQPPQHLPPSQEAYHSLTPSIRLYLANNELTSLPGEIYKIENLTELSIRQNKIATILPSITNLVNLIDLNLSGNKLNYLPWVFLDFVRSNKPTYLHLHPNPFLMPLVDHAGQFPERPRYASWEGLTLYATTPIAYLDVTGRACINSPPAPSSTEYCKPWTGLRAAAETYEWSNNWSHTPSLFELALRACASSPSSAQLPELLPDDSPSALPKWLKEASLAKDAGGTSCSVCHRQYVVPRAERLEWWQGVAGIAGPLPFLRRVCSWGCAPGFESGLEGKIDEMWRNCGWKVD